MIIKGSLSNSQIPLMPYIQSLTLRIVLSIMFNVDALALSSTAIDVVTASINALWKKSKLAANPNDAFQSQHRFRSALHDLLPDHNLDDPTSNPLNLILPAYETLWRIVVLGFVEIRFRTRTGGIQSASITALRAFLANPSGPDASYNTSTRKDTKSQGPCNITAFDIARELLRLYPSTKRVYRVFDSSPNLTAPVSVAADVEAIHRSTSIWGASAGVFDPSRWVPSVADVDIEKEKEKERERRDAYMPFGVYPFLCPARKDFGRRIIALLVASLVVGVRKEEEEQEDGWKLEVPELWRDVVSKGKEPLPSERGSFEGWALVRREDVRT